MMPDKNCFSIKSMCSMKKTFITLWNSLLARLCLLYLTNVFQHNVGRAHSNKLKFHVGV